MTNTSHGGNLHYYSRKYGLTEQDIRDFSANINPLGYPIGLKDELMSNLFQLNHYPDPDCNKLKEGLSDQLQVKADNIIIGNGAVDLIYLLVQNIRPKKVLIPCPTFSEYAKAAKTVSSTIEYVYLKESDMWELPLKEITSKVNGCDMLFLCNPNNPTGNTFKKNDIISLIDLCSKNGTFVVVDESFLDFSKEYEDQTVTNLLSENYSNLFILRSMTKFFSIPGLRLGYGLSSSKLIKKLENYRPPWSINCLAQIAGQKCYHEKKFIEDTIKLIYSEKDFLFDQLNKISGFKPFYPSANFILIDIAKTGFTAAELTDKMAREGILIRNCDNFPGLNKSYIRVAVKNRSDNQELLSTFQQVLGGDK